jgi:hypothetical protein
MGCVNPYKGALCEPPKFSVNNFVLAEFRKRS